MELSVSGWAVDRENVVARFFKGSTTDQSGQSSLRISELIDLPLDKTPLVGGTNIHSSL